MLALRTECTQCRVPAQVEGLVKDRVYRKFLVDSQRLQRNLTFTKLALYCALKGLAESSFKLTGTRLNKFLAENVPDFLLFWRGARKVMRGSGPTREMLISMGDQPIHDKGSGEEDGRRPCRVYGVRCALFAQNQIKHCTPRSNCRTYSFGNARVQP